MEWRKESRFLGKGQFDPNLYSSRIWMLARCKMTERSGKEINYANYQWMIKLYLHCQQHWCVLEEVLRCKNGPVLLFSLVWVGRSRNDAQVCSITLCITAVVPLWSGWTIKLAPELLLLEIFSFIHVRYIEKYPFFVVLQKLFIMQNRWILWSMNIFRSIHWNKAEIFSYNSYI